MLLCVENLAQMKDQYLALREEMDNYLNDLSNMWLNCHGEPASEVNLCLCVCVAKKNSNQRKLFAVFLSATTLNMSSLIWLPFLTCSLPSQFFPGCHPRVGFGFAEVPAGYLLWCRCTAELHVLNDEYTCQWHIQMHINWRDNFGSGSEWTC